MSTKEIGKWKQMEIYDKETKTTARRKNAQQYRRNVAEQK